MTRRPILPPALLVALWFAGTLPPAVAATYYVSNDGADGADGLTPGTAWQTLQHAADEVVAGDTVIVLPGAYQGFNLFTSGSAGAPITFTTAPGTIEPDPAVVIDSPNDFTNQDGVNLEGASWIVVEGFTVLGNGAISRAGLCSVGFPTEPAHHNALRANRVEAPGRWGILTGFVDDLLIEGNETSLAEEEHGIYVSNSSDRPVIRGTSCGATTPTAST